MLCQGTPVLLMLQSVALATAGFSIVFCGFSFSWVCGMVRCEFSPAPSRGRAPNAPAWSIVSTAKGAAQDTQARLSNKGRQCDWRPPTSDERFEDFASTGTQVKTRESAADVLPLERTSTTSRKCKTFRVAVGALSEVWVRKIVSRDHRAS